MSEAKRRMRWMWLIGLLPLTGVALWVAYFQSTKALAYDLVRPRNADRPATEAPLPEEVATALEVESEQGVIIDAWVVEPRAERPEGAVHWVVILHGIADEKTTMLGLARRFAIHGVGSILVDLRGHGRSSPTYLTYGAKESDDLSAVLDAVEAAGHPLGEVGVYGPSYGAAVGIQFAARDPRVRRAVAVASFASMRRQVRIFLLAHNPEWTPFVPDFFVDSMVDVAAMRAGFDPDRASPVEAIAEGNARYLIVHSPEDEIVPFDHAADMMAACGSRCELLKLDGLSHLGSLSNQPLRERMHRFLTGEALRQL